MDAFEETGYEVILNIVRQWPPGRRFTLVQDVLNTLAPEVALPRSRPKTLEKALGLLATSQPAPTDEQIKRWLDERRMEKYG
jgi:hypothetical protein